MYRVVLTGPYANFRNPATTTNSISFPAPPPTTARGIIGAIAGISREDMTSFPIAITYPHYRKTTNKCYNRPNMIAKSRVVHSSPLYQQRLVDFSCILYTPIELPAIPYYTLKLGGGNCLVEYLDIQEVEVVETPPGLVSGVIPLELVQNTREVQRCFMPSSIHYVTRGDNRSTRFAVESEPKIETNVPLLKDVENDTTFLLI